MWVIVSHEPYQTIRSAESGAAHGDGERVLVELDLGLRDARDLALGRSPAAQDKRRVVLVDLHTPRVVNMYIYTNAHKKGGTRREYVDRLGGALLGAVVAVVVAAAARRLGARIGARLGARLGVRLGARLGARLLVGCRVWENPRGSGGVLASFFATRRRSFCETRHTQKRLRIFRDDRLSDTTDVRNSFGCARSDVWSARRNVPSCHKKAFFCSLFFGTAFERLFERDPDLEAERLRVSSTSAMGDPIVALASRFFWRGSGQLQIRLGRCDSKFNNDSHQPLVDEVWFQV